MSPLITNLPLNLFDCIFFVLLAAVCAVVERSVTSSSANGVISACLGAYCYSTPARNSPDAFKSKRDAMEWCSNRHGQLASVDSQRDQDDIDTFRFSKPDLDDDTYFIETKATVSTGGLVCWPNAQGIAGL